MEINTKFMNKFVPGEVLIVWYQTTSVNYYDDAIETIVSQRLTNFVKFFYDDIDECIAFITNIKDEKVFLVLPSNAAHIIALIENISTIKYIYIYSDDLPASYTDMPCPGHTFRGSYLLKEQLIETIRQDVISYLKNLTHLSLQNCAKNNENTSQSINENPNKFLCSRLILDIFLKAPLSSISGGHQAMMDFI